MNEYTIWGRRIDKSKIKKEALLCRGFLIDEEANLVASSAEEMDPQYLFINYQGGKNLSALLKTLHSPKAFSYGFTTTGDSGIVNTNFITFKRCKFGAKAPVRFLDPGIALLVKTLPLTGTMSWLSCSGHFKESPFILMRDIYHFHWLKYVFSYLFKDNADKGFTFVQRSTGRWNNKLVFPARECLEDHYRVYWDIQDIARSLMDVVNSAKIRAAKELIRDEDMLFDESEIHRILKEVGVKRPTFLTAGNSL